MTGFVPENPGVLVMDVIAEIRRRFHVDNETVTSLAEAFTLCRTRWTIVFWQALSKF